MIRRTKIVATLGPACNNLKILERMIQAGVDVVRINFSHGTREQHIEVVELTRSLARAAGRTVGVLADLQGPKIRIGKFKNGKIRLEVGDQFILDSYCELGNQEKVGLDYKELPADLEAGATLMLDDGRIVLSVTSVEDHQVLLVLAERIILFCNAGTAASPTSTARSPRATIIASDASRISSSARMASERSIFAITMPFPPASRINSRACRMSSPERTKDTAR